MEFVNIVLFIVFVYIVASFKWISTLIFLVIVIFIYEKFIKEEGNLLNIERVRAIDDITSCPKPPKDGLPKWLLFPEYERARFINHIVSVLWNPHLKLALEDKIRKRLSWKLEILKTKYKKISDISIHFMDLGKFPPLFSGVKVCELKCDLCARHIFHDQKNCKQKYCAIEAEFVFVSEDMLVTLSIGYKKFKAKVSLTKLRISGVVQIKLADFVNIFPGFSSYTISFVTCPNVDFSLSFKTGSLAVTRLPKISKIIEPFLKQAVWTNFIYPKGKKFFIKTRGVDAMRKAGRLVKYGQRSKELEGSLIVELKEVVWDSPKAKETDYAQPVLMQTGNSFYKPNMGFFWFCVLSIKGTTMVNKSRHLHSNYVTRKLKFNDDFIFKPFNIEETGDELINPSLEIEIRFVGMRWDEIMGQGFIDIRNLVEKNGYRVPNLSVSVFRLVEFGGESEFKKVGSILMDVEYQPPNSLEKLNLPRIMGRSLDNQFYIVKNNLRRGAMAEINNEIRKKANSLLEKSKASVSTATKASNKQPTSSHVVSRIASK